MGDGVVRWLRAASSVWSLHARVVEGHRDLLERHAGVTCPLSRLPTEVLLCVVEHLEPYDLCSVAQTCAALERASSADCLWRRFCGDLGADAAGMRWKTKYMQWLAPRLKRFARRRQAVLAATSPAERALKVVLYGDRGVGKSTLRRRLTDDRYVPYWPPTTLDIPYWVQTLQVEGLAVTLHLWDCSAQARYRAVTRAFCRDADAVVVVYDITNPDSFGQAQPWVERIRAAISRDPDAQPPSVILVGAKSDLEEHRAVTAAAGQALARALGTLWAETSSLTGSGVREAFQLLAESVVLGELHPSAGGGWHIPDHDLLCRLYNNTNNNNNNTSSPATTGCALQ